MGDILITDTECYQNFWSIGFWRLSDDKKVVMELSDRKTLDVAKLERIIRNNTIVTYNGMAYDMPMIWRLICGANNELLKRTSDQIIVGRIPYWEAEDALGIRIPFTDHIDLMPVQPNAFAGLKVLNGRLHGPWMQDLPYEPDHILTHSQMDEVNTYMINDLDATKRLYEALGPALTLRRKLGRQYGMNFMCKSDSQIGEAIIKKRVEIATGSRVKRVPTSPGSTFKYKVPDFLKFETPEMIELVDRLREVEFVVQRDGKVSLPDFLDGRRIKLGFSTYAMGIGGLHSTESNRAVISDEIYRLFDVDVGSYYPAIILNSGLYPKSLGPAFLTEYRAIREARMAAKRKALELSIEKSALRGKEAGTEEAKREIKREYKRIDEALSDVKSEEQGLKISLNGTFGKLGSIYSVLYAPHLMIFVTLTGQLALLMLIERMEAAGISVVSGNTDGAVLRVPRDMVGVYNKKDKRIEDGEVANVIRQWEIDTGFDLEAVEYAGLYNASVNTYYAVKPDGSLKRKGTVQNPIAVGEEDIRAQLMKNPNMGVCSDAVAQHIVKGIPIEKYIREHKDIRNFVTVVNVKGGGTWKGDYLGKVVRYIWSTDGAEILYKTPDPRTGNYKKVSRSDGCRPVMTLPETLPDDIDYDRYIQHANEILMDVGFIERPEPIKPVRVFKYNAIAYFAIAV